MDIKSVSIINKVIDNYLEMDIHHFNEEAKLYHWTNEMLTEKLNTSKMRHAAWRKRADKLTNADLEREHGIIDS